MLLNAGRSSMSRIKEQSGAERKVEEIHKIQ